MHQSSVVSNKIDLHTFITLMLIVDFMMFVEETRMFLEHHIQIALSHRSAV